MWDGYTEFERSLLSSLRSAGPLSAARSLSDRMLSSAQAIYTASQKVYDELQSVQCFGGFRRISGELAKWEFPPEPLHPSRMMMFTVSGSSLFFSVVALHLILLHYYTLIIFV